MTVSRRIHSFSRRGNHLGQRHEELLARNQQFLIDAPRVEDSIDIAPDAEINLAEAFGRNAPVVVEIGPGSGEQAVAFAIRHPHINMLLIEAWHPGVGRCVSSILRESAPNVRVIEADAAQALPVIFGLACARATSPDEVLALGPAVDPLLPGAANPRASEVWTFFPDPWRKVRHHKRRLVSDSFATVVAGVLEDQGVWRMATDWDNYAWQMRDVIESSPYFTNPFAGQHPDPNDAEPARGGFADRWDERVATRFEERGVEEGRTIHDLVGVRRPRA